MLEAGIALLILIGLLLSGLPVAFSYITAVLFMVFVFGYDPRFLLPSSAHKISSVVLLTLPFFILAGSLMEKGGTTKYLIDFVDSIVSRMRGGLGTVGVFTNGIFGALSGSSAAAIACIGSILIPRMVREGYPRGYATSLLTSAAGISNLIPPSILMILYGWLSLTSVSACFLAGMFPGILLMLIFSLINWIMVGRLPMVKKPHPWGSVKQLGREVVHTGWRAIPALLMPILILGSIYGGIATPTEAAAVAMFYAILIGFLIYRGLTPRGFANSLIQGCTITGAIMIMLFCAMMIGRIFVMEHIPDQVAAFILGISENKYVILLMVNLIVFIFGMFIDDITCMIITIPLLFPIVVTTLGISPVHFAAILTTNVMMGCYTPPVAPMLYIGQRVGETTFPEMLKPSMMFVFFAYMPVLLITTYWAPLSMWLPELILGPEVLMLP